MNVDKIRRLADFIEAEAACPTFDVGFNMGDWIRRADGVYPDRTGHSCGTVACVAGWACILFEGRDFVVNELTKNHVMYHAKSHLELTEVEAYELFTTEPRRTALVNVPPEVAVACLRHFADTGVVDWTRADILTNPDHV